MDAILIKAAQIILILSIIVILHELGHFIPAKYFGTKVEKFFLFFDVKFALFKKKIGETVYGIGWLPLGGYVKIAGMIDESMDTEQMKKPAQPWEFRSKPAWQRLIIMLGGITVNIILAIIIFTATRLADGETYVAIDKMENGIRVDSAQADLGLKSGDIPYAVNGKEYTRLEELSKRALIEGGTLSVKRDGQSVDLTIEKQDLVHMLEKKGSFFLPEIPVVLDTVFSVAKEAGLQASDKIVSVNGSPIKGWWQLSNLIPANGGKEIQLEVDRNGSSKAFTLQVPIEGKIGVGPKMDFSSMTETKKFGFFDALVRGVNLTFGTIVDQVQSFSVLWKLKGEATKYVSGPIGIAKQLPAVWDWGFFWNFTAVLSAWLAFVNLLPIPGLDGGHALFTLYEIVTRRKPGEKFLEIAQYIGVIFLLALMIFIFGNDIFNLIYN